MQSNASSWIDTILSEFAAGLEPATYVIRQASWFCYQHDSLSVSHFMLDIFDSNFLHIWLGSTYLLIHPLLSFIVHIRLSWLSRTYYRPIKPVFTFLHRTRSGPSCAGTHLVYFCFQINATCIGCMITLVTVHGIAMFFIPAIWSSLYS